MYQLTWKLFALFPLILPIFAAATVEEADVLQMRAAHSGRGTHFTPGVGSCGGTNYESQMVVALSAAIMNKDVDCWKMVQITSNGKTVDAQVVDTCPGCGPNDLDLSTGLFQKFASPDVGVIPIEWDELY